MDGVNYFGLTPFSIFRMLFISKAASKEEQIEIKDVNDMPAPDDTTTAAAATTAATTAASAAAPIPPPAIQGDTNATPPPIPPLSSVNDKPITVSHNVKVINQNDEYGNFNQLGIVSNVLDPKQDEKAKGITEKRYIVKMPDGKTYPYYRNEIELFE